MQIGVRSLRLNRESEAEPPEDTFCSCEGDVYNINALMIGFRSYWTIGFCVRHEGRFSSYAEDIVRDQIKFYGIVKSRCSANIESFCLIVEIFEVPIRVKSG